MKDRAIKQMERFSLRPDFMRNIIIILIIFSVLFLVLSNATGLNTTNISESQISESQTFTFGSLTVLDSSYNPFFCLITLYDTDGIVKISDTDSMIIDTINPGSHIYIESQEKNIAADISIDGDSFDPVITLENYGTSNPGGNNNPPGLPLEFVSIASDNLSYNNIQLTINYPDDATIDAGDLRIFKYVETFAYNGWVELPTSVDEINKAVSADTDSGTIFAVSVPDETGYSKNITFGNLSVLNSIGVVQQAGIEIISTDGVIAASTGILSINEVPQGSHFIINSFDKNVTLDFTLDNDSLNPMILLEDFGVDNPAGNYLPPGKPVKYFMINAENLGYSNVDLTIHNPNVYKNIGLFRLDETFEYNEWGEITTAIDKINNTLSASLNSFSIFALSEKPREDMNVVDVENKPLTVDINTYDSNKIVQKSKRGNKLLRDEMPDAGYIKIDALDEKDIAVTINAADTFGGDIILDNYGKHNPKNINPDRAFVKFVEIHAGNMNYGLADIEIQYSDDEIVSFDESKLQIAHYAGGDWVKLNSIVDAEHNIVRASTDSFSTFAVIYNGTSVNTRKSIYQPGEIAEIVIVVLDSAGAPVSNASIRMNVTAPNGSTEYFSSISSIMETSDPGVYEAAYLTGMEGQYNISCTAIIEENESRFDTYFMVLSEYDFDIIRYAQSKIDPIKYDTFYVTIDIISYTDADNIVIWEYVPADFEVYTDAVLMEADNLKVLTWQRSLVNNRTSVNYSYSVPKEWPKLYQLGPVEIDYGNRTFTEARSWWVAVDPPKELSSVTMTEPSSDPNILVTQTFSMSCYWTQKDGGGSDLNVDLYFEYDQGTGTWVTIPDSDGLSTSDINPKINTNNGVTYPITVTGSTAGVYNVRCKAYDHTNSITKYSAPQTVTVGTAQPSATSRWNNKTNDNSSALTINVSEEIEFGIVYDQTGNITWNATGYTNRSNISVLSGNQTYNWSTSGTKYLNASMNNTNGTSPITPWSIIVQSISDAPSITNVSSYGVTHSQAHITWDTNQSDSDNRVKYSIYPNLSDHNWSSWDNDTDSIHILLTDLSPSTKYYYSAYSYNGINNSLYSNSSIYNFTTTGNATAQGNVKDKGGGQLTCNITAYDEDGTTVLNSTTGHSFDLYDVPIGGYILFDANSSKDVLAKFKINDNSSNAVIILDDYGLNNPESTAAPWNPMKYVNVSATNLSYESVEIKISYTDAELDSMDESQLAIYHYKNGAWSELSTSVDAANNILTASTTSLSTFAATAANLFYTVVARTDKAVYLMDPYNWVYVSNNANWIGGHSRNVTINTMVIDPYGRLVPNERYPSEPTVRYNVINATEIEVANGTMTETRTGFYYATFEINETNLGGNNANYSTGSLPKTYTVYVNAIISDKEVNTSDTIKVNRWSCDQYSTDTTSCHYPYSSGPHSGSWNEMLGGENTGSAYFDITLLQNANKTHTPPDIYDNNGKHETTIKSMGGCSNDCHRSSTSPVLCTDCHDTPIYGAHTNVADPDATWPNCANTSCHGRLNTTAVNRVYNSFPKCSDCHPISYRDNFTATSQNLSVNVVPQWLNTTTGTPRDVAVHPNPDNAIVNCSFCHNSFHNLYSQSSVLACFDCHQVAEDYSNHNGTLTPLTGVNCTSCHNNTVDKIDIHDTITPACSQCHNEANHSSYNTTGVNCLQCHNDNLFNYSGSVLVNNSYWTNTSIHSQDEILPNCTICHTGYANHSSYETSGVYCTSCHNNATLDYNSTRNLLVNDTGIYNTTYNTNTSIHTLTSSEMIPDCTACHGSPQYQTHLGSQTNVSLGLAANCTQCHDNQTLNYTGTILPVQGNYNTGSEIHTTGRTLMLPDQTPVYNDNCGKCHYQIYGSGYDLHSGGSNCSVCHYGDYMEYQGTFRDKPIEHSINITRMSCTECHFNWTKMNSSINQPDYYVNGTMFNDSVHSLQTGIQCRDCHTSAHPPPEYSWKWCECCHAYQSDPLNENDRHNVTADPLNYSINVSGTLTPVLDITDCTICHNATLYNTSRETFNRTSGKDCRYCHTFPDQTYN